MRQLRRLLFTAKAAFSVTLAQMIRSNENEFERPWLHSLDLSKIYTDLQIKKKLQNPELLMCASRSGQYVFTGRELSFF